MKNKVFINALNKSYENKIISRGDNFPSIYLSENNLGLISILLHFRMTINEIKDYLSLSEVELNNKLNLLLNEGLIKKKEGKFLPTFLIVKKEDGEKFYSLSDEIGNEIINLIIDKMEKIKGETFKIQAFKEFSFEELSLFILSDVILDFIQIDNVEELFLKTKRPDRNNKYYYYSLMKNNPHTAKEAFGIYGNHCKNIGEVVYCIYGNKRYSSPNLLTITKKEVVEIFDSSLLETDNFKELLIDKIIRFSYEEITLDNSIKRGYEKLNIIYENRVLLPILNNNEYNALYKIADVIKDELIKILVSNREKFHKIYSQSSYKDETTFEEFFIWYYHFLYSFVTEKLIEKEVIYKPKGDLFSFIIKLHS